MTSDRYDIIKIPYEDGHTVDNSTEKRKKIFQYRINWHHASAIEKQFGLGVDV